MVLHRGGGQGGRLEAAEVDSAASRLCDSKKSMGWLTRVRGEL